VRTAMGRDGHVTAARDRFSRQARTNLRIAPRISFLRRPLYASSLYLTPSGAGWHNHAAHAQPRRCARERGLRHSR
jgi:hypothetical protein